MIVRYDMFGMLYIIRSMYNISEKQLNNIINNYFVQFFKAGSARRVSKIDLHELTLLSLHCHFEVNSGSNS